MYQTEIRERKVYFFLLGLCFLFFFCLAISAEKGEMKSPSVLCYVAIVDRVLVVIAR